MFKNTAVLRNYYFQAYVRNAALIPAIEKRGVKVIRGDHSNVELIKQITSKVDIVINCADADDLELTRAIIAGLESKEVNDGARLPILIHTRLVAFRPG
jgi:putative NADH-flavin reductase